MQHLLLSAVALLLLGAAAFAADFPDVSKLPARTELPDPLVMLDGTRVTTKEQWETKRRPELKALFQHYMYGNLPEPLKIEAKVEREDPKALDGKATLKEVTIRFGPPRKGLPRPAACTLSDCSREKASCWSSARTWGATTRWTRSSVPNS